MFFFRKALLVFLLSSLPTSAQTAKITELPLATAGVHYQVALNIQAQGVFPFRMAITQGSLPDGLAVNQSGVVEGIPKGVSDQVFVVTLTDAVGKSQDLAFRARTTEPPPPAPENAMRATTGTPRADKNNVKASLENYDDKDDGQKDIQIIGGVEQAGVASLPNQTNAFLSAFGRVGEDYPARKVWFRVRLLGQPTASTGGVISAFQDPTGQIKNFDTQKVGQAADFIVGPEYQIPHFASRNGRFSMHLVAGIGATTPLSSEDVVSRFKVPSKTSPMCADVQARFTPQNGYPANLVLPNTDPTSSNCLANGITVLAFNRQERTSFLRKYGFGIRMIDRFKYASKDSKGKTVQTCCERGIADFVIGQDEAITGGHLRGWVFRMDAVHPLQIKNQSYLYIFGTVALRLHRNSDLRTLILDPDTSNATPSAPNVALLPLKQPNKDFYRFGVGLDVKKIFAKLFATDSQPQENGGGN